MLERLIQAGIARLDNEQLARVHAHVLLRRGQGWGSATIAAEVAAAAELAGPDAELIADVGANRGAWTQAALSAFPRAHVHAFEPSRSAFELLAEAVGREPRVSLHNVALGASAGTRTLYADEAASGIASLTRRRLSHFEIEMDIEEKVTMWTLSDWFRESGAARVNVLKLDVEGHELEVMQGAEAFLERIDVIQFEFGGCNIDTRTYLQDFWYFLTGAGYHLHRLGPGGLTRVSAYRELDEVFVTTNYFAARA